jgi:hypothetical protein
MASFFTTSKARPSEKIQRIHTKREENGQGHTCSFQKTAVQRANEALPTAPVSQTSVRLNYKNKS